jgi:hypothetical protein
MELIVGAVTVTVVVCLIAPMVAEIVADPAEMPVTKPVAFTMATAGADEFQFTSSVISRLLPSLYEPVAVNC